MEQKRNRDIEEERDYLATEGGVGGSPGSAGEEAFPRREEAEEEDPGLYGVFGSVKGSSERHSGHRELRRLVDVITDYLRQRRGDGPGDRERRAREGETARAVIRHIRANPIPSALLGVSIGWLLLAKVVQEADGIDEFPGENEVDAPDAGFADRLEKELVDHVSEGYDQPRKRLGEIVQRYPWAAAATVMGASVLAGLFLPPRRSPSPAPEDIFQTEDRFEDEL